MKKLIGIFLIVVFVSGCATAPQLQPVRLEAKLINLPQLNVVTEGEIGQTIVSKTYVSRTYAARIDKDGLRSSLRK